jgi:hypothetical protein
MTIHQRPMQDMTLKALACRSDEICEDNCVTDILGNGDYREIRAFLTHDQIGWGDGWKTVGKDIIGVALCDLDDDAAPAEILTRAEAVDMLGHRWAEGLEVVE